MSAEQGQRLAVVTGAGSGVGRATVAGLAEDGFRVLGVDLAEPPGELAVEGLEWVQGDVTDPATWEAVSARVEELDPAGAEALVSCAADMIVEPFLTTPAREFQRLFDVNVLGTVLAMQALIPAMQRRGRGYIAVVCSVDSLYTEMGMVAYSASKAALLQTVRSAAIEHSAEGLRVNAVCPGAIDTPLLRRALEEAPDPEAELAGATTRIPAGVILDPAEVAAVLRFLVSDGASGMSGAALAVDGGLTATYDYRPE